MTFIPTSIQNIPVSGNAQDWPAFKAVNVDGVDEKYNVAAGNVVLEPDITDSFSFFCWARNGTAGAIHRLAGNQVIASGGGWNVFMWEGAPPGSNKLRVGLHDGTNENYVYSNASHADTTRYHLFGFTYDGSGVAAGISLFYDGAADPQTTGVSNAMAGSMIPVAKPFSYGDTGDIGSVLWDGALGDAVAFDYVLSGAEITELYNGGHPGYVPAMSMADPVWFVSPHRHAITAGGVAVMRNIMANSDHADPINIETADLIGVAP